MKFKGGGTQLVLPPGLSRSFCLGVVVPKYPNIPRVSVVVPKVGDNQSFELTLASVLQHLGNDCEVIVPHAGDYDDPFDLKEEVRFVEAGTPHVLNQIGVAAEAARGRFVHILSGGMRATAGWTDRAVEKFEHHDAGLVVPAVCDETVGDVLHFGWTRSARSACELVNVKNRRQAEGGFLTASFWRRDLLRSLASTYRGRDVLEASMVYSLASRQAKWRCVVADDCVISSTASAVEDLCCCIDENHRRLQAIADHSGKSRWGQSAQRFLATWLTRGLGSAVRRATAPLANQQVSKLIRQGNVAVVESGLETLSIPTRRSQFGTPSQASRRAA